MNLLRVLVININNLQYTKDCINDLLNQTTQNFDILLVDNGSTEAGTHNYYSTLDNRIRIKYNDQNVGVNRVWDGFVNDSKDWPYLCFLNNDVRLSKRFIQDTIEVFDKETTVGVVSHTTNHLGFQSTLPSLKYDVLDYKYKQGWDFSIRTSLYVKIPDEIKIYCGDDWIFHQIYEQGYKGAFVTSSPIIHYQGKSTHFGARIIGSANSDYKIYTEQMKQPHYLRHLPKYSNIKPTFPKILSNE